jgi:pimeloyl-ACP methyl ester carboxylesterase
MAGQGAPFVFVHGAWADRTTWEPVFYALSRHYTVVRYDRRGYGESQHPGVELEEHVSDLLKLIRALGLKVVTLVGNSLGAVISIRAALRYPEHIARVVAHEPPYLRLLEQNPVYCALALRIRNALSRTFDAVRNGDCRLAAQYYVDDVAATPGTWQYLSETLKMAFARNARTFLIEGTAVTEGFVATEELLTLAASLLITSGEHSNQSLKVIAEELCSTVPTANRYVFKGAGHVPHQTCPKEFINKMLELAIQS